MSVTYFADYQVGILM